MKPIFYAQDGYYLCPKHAGHDNPIGHPVFSWELTDDEYCDVCNHKRIEAERANKVWKAQERSASHGAMCPCNDCNLLRKC